jgi:hypothetical protein
MFHDKAPAPVSATGEYVQQQFLLPFDGGKNASRQPVTSLEKRRAAEKLPLNEHKKVLEDLGAVMCDCTVPTPMGPAGWCSYCGVKGPAFETQLRLAELNGERQYEQLELPDSGLLAGIRSGKWLDEQDFPELEYVIPGLIPEGLTLLIGPPKSGKSWMLLAFCLAVSAGGMALNAIKTGEPKRVLYLALEDGDRRMQSRCRSLLGDKARIPDLFHYVTTVRPGEMHALLAEFLGAYPGTAMIVIDTLGKVMPPSTPGESSYQRDYRVASQIKKIADDKPGLAVLVAHHDRKAASEDFVDAVSGTHGLAGAADTITVLCRKRQSPEAIFKVTGRDVPEAEYALVLDSSQSWRLAGDDLAAAETEARNRSDKEGLGDIAGQVLSYVQGTPEGVKRAEVEKMFPGVQVDVYLLRLVNQGRIDKIGRGVYVAA